MFLRHSVPLILSLIVTLEQQNLQIVRCMFVLHKRDLPQF